MTARFDAIVVGGGVLGAAIAHALQTTPGLGRVALLERAGLASGATARSGGMVRAFHADAGLTDLAAASLPTWHARAAQVGFVRTGALYVAPAGRRDAVLATAARLLAAGVRAEVLDAPAARARFPQAAFADDELAVVEPDAGFVDPLLATLAFADDARRAGATIVEDAGVETLLVADGRVTGLVAAGETYAARTVVLAAGLGTAGLLAGLGLDLGLFAKAIQVNRLAGAPVDHPCFMDLANRAFGRPVGREASWVGVATEDLVADGPLVASAADADRAFALAAARFPALASRRPGASIRTADTYTHGATGLLGPVAGVDGLLLAAGFGGTGLKIAPAVAARVAALVAPLEIRS